MKWLLCILAFLFNLGPLPCLSASALDMQESPLFLELKKMITEVPSWLSLEKAQHLPPQEKAFFIKTSLHILRVTAYSFLLAKQNGASDDLIELILKLGIHHDREKIDDSAEFRRVVNYSHPKSILTRLTEFDGLDEKKLPDTHESGLDKTHFRELRNEFNHMGDLWLEHILKQEGLSLKDPLVQEALQYIQIADKHDTSVHRKKELNRPLIKASEWFLQFEKNPSLYDLALILENSESRWSSPIRRWTKKLFPRIHRLPSPYFPLQPAPASPSSCSRFLIH